MGGRGSHVRKPLAAGAWAAAAPGPVATPPFPTVTFCRRLAQNSECREERRAPGWLRKHPNKKMRLRDDRCQTLAEDYHCHTELTPDGQTRETVGGFAGNPVRLEVAATLLRDAT